MPCTSPEIMIFTFFIKKIKLKNLKTYLEPAKAKIALKEAIIAAGTTNIAI